MSKKNFIFVLAILISINISAKDVYMYSYQAQRVEFINQAFITLLDSIIGHIEDIRTNNSCLCMTDSIAIDVSIYKTLDWPSDKRMAIDVHVDQMKNYLWKDNKYVSFFNHNGTYYRIKVDICCEDDVDWVNVARSEFFITTDTIQQKKYDRRYTNEEIKNIYNRGCMLEEDGGTEIWFAYVDGIFIYWEGRFCDGSVLFP